MKIDKGQLRTFYKGLRAALSDDELKVKSLKINEHVQFFLKDRSDLSHFHLFFPIPKQREIDTYPIKVSLEERGCIIYTSRVESQTLKLETLRLVPGTEFQFDKWGIPIPEEFDLVTNELIQVVFVPLLAYDGKGNRVGFGKGYYDVFLSSLEPSVLKIGLSFFAAETAIPSELHDIPLDYCITPENIITF